MAANDLTTVQNVQEFLDIKNTNDVSMLGRLITAVSVSFERYADRTFKTSSYIHTFDGNGALRQVLREYPVTAVSSVLINGVSIPQAATVLNSGYRYDQRSVILTGYSFTQGFQNVVIAYTAGFTSIPLDLEQACIEQVAYLYRLRKRLGESSTGLAGATTTYITKSMLDTVKSVLDQYRNRVPV